MTSLGQAPEETQPNWHGRANTLPIIRFDKWCHLVLYCVDAEVVMGTCETDCLANVVTQEVTVHAWLACARRSWRTISKIVVSSYGRPIRR